MFFNWGLVFFYSVGDTSAHQALSNASLHGSRWKYPVPVAKLAFVLERVFR
jgi:hypothetical protein